MRSLPGDLASNRWVINSPYATAAPAQTSATTTPYSLRKLVKSLLLRWYVTRRPAYPEIRKFERFVTLVGVFLQKWKWGDQRGRATVGASRLGNRLAVSALQRAGRLDRGAEAFAPTFGR